MRLSTRSWLYWWAYLPENIINESTPYSTSVCALFWRCIFEVPAKLALLAFLSPFIGMGYLIFKVGDYIVAIKSKVCLLITWEDTANGS